MTLEFLLEPLQYEFMTRALIASAVVGVMCAILSCYMILKNWSLMGDAVSHAVLPGVVISFILNIPFSVGAFISGLLAVLMIGFVKRNTRLKEDAVMGIIFTGFFALGLVLVSRFPSNIDLTHILFGNVLGISRDDIIQVLIVGAIVVTAMMILRKDLMLFSFDENQARAIGLNTTFLYYALLVLLALTIVVSLQTVGIILVISMLITPGAIGYMLTDRFDRMMIYAVTSSLVSSLGGAYASYFLDGSTGGSIVLFQTLIFVVVLIVAPKRGLLARQLRSWHERTQPKNTTSVETAYGTGD
jgi:manganese transport system permease protein